MPYDRRSFAGGAVATTLTSGIDGSTLTIPIAAATGWPTGSAGDFYIVIDRGTASEEKIRVDTRTTLTLTAIAGGRGVDGTSAVSHASGAAVELCLTAVDLDEANAHIADTALDHHTQYLNNARHDVEARHAFGAALGTPPAPAAIGTAAAAGTGARPAREDHVHIIGTGAISAATMFAAGVVNAAAIATDGVGTDEIAASAVTAAELAADAVTTAKILNGNVTLAKLATTLAPPILVADTTARLALTPTDGMVAVELDTERWWQYMNTAWRYLFGGTGWYDARAYLTTATTITAGSAEVIVFNNEDFDLSGSMSTVTGKYVATIAGDYSVDAAITCELNENPEEIGIAVYKNAVLYSHGTRYAIRGGATNDRWVLTVSAPIRLAAADEVTIVVANSGANVLPLVESSADSWMHVRKQA